MSGGEGDLLDAKDVSLALSMALKKAESASGDLAEALALARLAAESGDSGDGDGDDAAAAAAAPEDGGGLADDPDVQDAFLGDAPDYHSKSYWDDRYQKMPEPVAVPRNT